MPYAKILAVLAIIWLLIGLFAIAYWLLSFISNIILLILLGTVLAIGLSSLTDWLQKRIPLKRSWILIVGIYVTLLLVTISIVLVVGLPLVFQIKQLIDNYPNLVAEINQRFAGLQGLLGRFGLKAVTFAELSSRTTSLIKNYGQFVFSGFLSFILVFSSGVGQFILIVVISFYLLLEKSRINESIIAAVPENYQKDAAAFSREVKTIITSFIGGQLFLALLMGAVAAIFAIALSLPYSALIGVFVAVTGLIPIVGSILGAIPALLIAYSVSAWKALVFLVLFVLFSQFVSYYLQPKIVGKAIGLNPLTILIALLIGFQAAGFWGAIFAAPVLSILFVFIKYTIRWYESYIERA
jgi:predicted PurR-regulated permease PerM